MSIEGQPLSGIRWVDRETLQANDYNPNHVAPIEMGLLKTSIMETGWTQPIVVLVDNLRRSRSQCDDWWIGSRSELRS